MSLASEFFNFPLNSPLFTRRKLKNTKKFVNCVENLSMSIISVVISNKNGKILLSRSYEKITRYKLEGLIISFPKLIDKNQQHTYCENDSYRYVYTLLGETMYLMLLTHKRSNVVEDIQTLRTLYNLTQEKILILEEEKVHENSFELLFVYDELIVAGHTEMLNTEQINTILKMESHEENLHDMVLQNRIKEAMKKAKKKEKEIKEILKKSDGRYTSGIESKNSGNNIEFTQQYEQTKFKGISSSPTESIEKEKERIKTGGFKKPKGLKLSGISRSRDLGTGSKLLQDMGIDIEDDNDEDKEEQKIEKNIPVKNKEIKPIIVKAIELLAVEIDGKDDDNSTISLKGLLEISVNDKKYSNVRIIMDNTIKRDSFKFKQHPTTDSELFEKQNIIGAKKSKNFNVGGSSKILQWRMKKRNDESILPITVTCWPSESSSGMSVSLEFEIEDENLNLYDLTITIPIPPTGKVVVGNLEVGTYKVVGSSAKRRIVWSISPQYKKGNFEFVINEGSESSFYPIVVNFTSSQLLSGLKIKGVKDVNEKNVLCDLESQLSVEKYFYTN